MIRLGSDPAALAGLQAAVAAAGLDGDDDADLLAVPADGPGALSLARLAPFVDSVLSTSLPEGPLAALPCVDAAGVAALGALARDEGTSWAINICAPNWWSAASWGDLHFARALQRSWRAAAIRCLIQVLDEWEQSRDGLLTTSCFTSRA